MDRRAREPGHRRTTDPPGFRYYAPEEGVGDALMDRVSVLSHAPPTPPATLLGLMSLEDLTVWGDADLLTREVRARFALG